MFSAGGMPPIGVIGAGSGLVEDGSSGFGGLPIGFDSAPLEPCIGLEGSFSFGGSFDPASGGGISPDIGMGFGSAGFARSSSLDGAGFADPELFCSSNLS